MATNTDSPDDGLHVEISDDLELDWENPPGLNNLPDDAVISDITRTTHPFWRAVPLTPDQQENALTYERMRQAMDDVVREHYMGTFWRNMAEESILWRTLTRNQPSWHDHPSLKVPECL